MVSVMLHGIGMSKTDECIGRGAVETEVEQAVMGVGVLNMQRSIHYLAQAAGVGQLSRVVSPAH